jgi:hypothetical protein
LKNLLSILSIFVILFITCNFCSAQISMKIRNHSINKSIDNSSKIIFSNNFSFKKEIVIEVYKNKMFDEANLLSTSSTIILDPGISELNLFEVLLLEKYVNNETKDLCFKIIDNESSALLAVQCERIVANTEKQKNASKPIQLGLDVTYESSLFNNTFFNSISGNSDLSVYKVPFKINGYYSDYRDNYFNQNLNQLTLSFDQKQWSRKAEDIAKSRLSAEREKTLGVSDAYYNKLKSNSNYYNSILSNVNIQKEMKEYDRMCSEDFFKKINNVEDISKKIDSIKKNVALLSEKTSDVYNKFSNTSKDTSVAVISNNVSNNKLLKLDASFLKDSVQSQLNKIEKLEKFKLLNQKTSIYRKLLSKKDSVENSIKLIQNKYDVYKKFEVRSLKNPSKLNELIRDTIYSKKIYQYLNYLSNFKIGLINPNYSRLVISSSRMKGIYAGIKVNRLEISAFTGRMTSYGINALTNELRNIDTTSTRIAGGNIKYDITDWFRGGFFIMDHIGENVYAKNPVRIFGQTIEASFNDDTHLNVETSWSINNKINSNENPISASTSILRNMAFYSIYQVKNKKYNYKLEAEYFGIDYNNFSRNALKNNSIKVRANFRYTLSKIGAIGINGHTAKNNLWGNNFLFDNNYGLGGDIAFNYKKLPTINYSYTNVSYNGPLYVMKNTLQNATVNANFRWLGLQSSVLINGSNSNFTSNVDSLDFSMKSLMVSHRTEIAKQLELFVSYNTVSNDRKNNFNQSVFELSLPYTYKNLIFDLGVKYLHINHAEKVGYNLDLSLNLSHATFVLAIDPISQYQNVNADVFVQNIYQPAGKLSINYKIQ